MRGGTGSRLESVANTVLWFAAIAMASVVIYRQLAPRPQPIGAAPQVGRFHEDWKGLEAISQPIGESRQAIHLIEFADMECGACRGFHEVTLPELRSQVSIPFSVALIHLPLPGHRFAKQAAKASECAAVQGRFAPFLDLVMAKQDSIGLKNWESFASEAGVPQAESFAACYARQEVSSRVDAGLAAAHRLGIHATPSVLVNGWQVSLTTVDELERVILEVAANRDPYPGRTVRRSKP